MKKLLTFAYLWILALPLFLGFAGAASNQLVLAANHDKFPVMVNARKLREFEQAQEQPVRAIEHLFGVDDPPQAQNDPDGMLDDVHCVMTKDTHLNFLADWIDLKDATYSPGDLLLEAGDYTGQYSFWVWFALILAEIKRKNADLEDQYR